MKNKCEANLLKRPKAGGNAGPALPFAIKCQWPGVPQPGRYAF